MSSETLSKVPRKGGEVTLHSHLVVRDDAMQLYGFASEQERDLFLMLIGVQSVGPKVALAVLSGGTPTELLAALAAGDVARFQAVPGIGKRTAERIIVELREKVAGAVADEIVVTRAPTARAPRRARASWAWASTRARPTSCSTRPTGETTEELIAGALKAAR